ncbi:MAG TPA: hypothetical protein VF899_03155 [Pyrinomonadaceae bacterium]
MSELATTIQPFTNKKVLDSTTETMWSALAVLLLTTVHHVYGAYIYNTPWRYHVAIVSTVTAAIIFASLRVLRRQTGRIVRKIAFWTFAVVTLAIPVITIGIFEGGYNHAVKDVLYFTGASPELMQRLFPPPTYEMPNDVFFEITGVLQLVAGIMTGWYLIGAARAHLRGL